MCTRDLLGTALSLIVFLSAPFPFVLLSSLSPTSYRSPVDKNRNKIGEGCKSERDRKLNPRLQQQRKTKWGLSGHISPHYVLSCLSAKVVGLIGGSHPSGETMSPGDSWLWMAQCRQEQRAEHQLGMERCGNHHNLACVSPNGCITLYYYRGTDRIYVLCLVKLRKHTHTHTHTHTLTAQRGSADPLCNFKGITRYHITSSCQI